MRHRRYLLKFIVEFKVSVNVTHTYDHKLVTKPQVISMNLHDSTVRQWYQIRFIVPTDEH